MGQRPVQAGESTVYVGFRFNESLVSSIDDLAKKRNMNRSDLTREALRQYLEQEVAAS